MPGREGSRYDPRALASHRSQELHLRPESHPYLPELGKSEMDFIDSKRPRLELLPDPLLRPSPLLAAGQPGGSEDLSKVRPGPQQAAPDDVGFCGSGAAGQGTRKCAGPGDSLGRGWAGTGQPEEGQGLGWLRGPLLGWRGTAPTRVCAEQGHVPPVSWRALSFPSLEEKVELADWGECLRLLL